jgi:hypothetical protein
MGTFLELVECPKKIMPMVLNKSSEYDDDNWSYMIDNRQKMVEKKADRMQSVQHPLLFC